MTLKPEENLELESIQELFPKMMRTHEIKKYIHEITKWKGKTKQNNLIQINIYMVSKNLKQNDLLVKLQWIKAIY